MSTAPQFGRSCYVHADVDGRMALGHAGSAPGAKIQVLLEVHRQLRIGPLLLSVQPNGDVPPCVYIPHRIIGNLKEKTMREIWQKNVYFETLTVRDNLKDHCHCLRLPAGLRRLPRPRRRLHRRHFGGRPRLHPQPAPVGEPDLWGRGRGRKSS